MGFEMVKRQNDSVELLGPGMNSTRQKPVLGATVVRVELRGQQLRLEAELGGIDSLRRFMRRFPLALGLGLGALFGIGGGVVFG
jgi:hypothetical protein